MASSSTSIDRRIDSKVASNKFCQGTATKSLKVTCYGSSSSKTPSRYLEEARSLGYILAQRSHICINGAGSYGCMAAMNDGVLAGNGHVRGVIHEMFSIDNGYVIDTSNKTVRRGSSHRVFENATLIDQHNDCNGSRIDFDACDDATIVTEKSPIREIVVAGGKCLQERKRLLVENTDALIVLPGGPGTWDELWEMACARHLNLNQLPIVCVNVEGFYEPFQEMLDRAYRDELIRLPPNEIIHFASSAEDAVRFIECHQEKVEDASKSQNTNNTHIAKAQARSKWYCQPSWCNHLALTFLTGATFGVVVATLFPLRKK